MKYCPKCKVNVHHQKQNCPLCGNYLDEKDNNEKCSVYTDIDDCVAYPVLHEINNTSFFKFKFNRILLILLAFCIVLNILVTPQYHWSAYAAMGVIFVIFCVMTPINVKHRLARYVRTDVFILTLLAVGMEFAVLDGKFQWFVVEYVLPWIYVAAIVLTDILILTLRHRNKQLFSTLIFCTVFAITPQVIFWITDGTDVYHPKTVINFVVFFASILNLIGVFLLANRSLKEEMERNMSV